MNKQQTTQKTSMSKLINLILKSPHQNHQVECPLQIQSQPCYWAEPNVERKTSPHNVQKVEDRITVCQAPKFVWLTILLEWLEDSWLSNRRPPLLQSMGEQPLGAFWYGPMTITRMYICLPWVYYERMQCEKPQWLSPHCLIWHPACNLKEERIHHNRHQHI